MLYDEKHCRAVGAGHARPAGVRQQGIWGESGGPHICGPYRAAALWPCICTGGINTQKTFGGPIDTPLLLW